MAPSNLQGLNIIRPPQSHHTDPQDLLSGPTFPELSAQLDLWSNLTFDSDEPPMGTRTDDEKYHRKSAVDDDDDDNRSPVTGEKAIHDGHVNVVTGTNIGSNENANHAPQAFDLNAFLAGFGIDPFSAAPAQQQQQPQSAIAPSLAQLLALHSNSVAYPPPTLPTSQSSFPSGSAMPSAFTRTAPNRPSEEAFPPTKRTRTRKTSVSTVASPTDYREDTPSPTGPQTGLSAAEDKRRRNTAASARFRLKKKEREAALEGKAKELETRVNELERECEGLRRENGWLKGLVVGVTGAAQGPVVPPSVTPPPSLMSLTTAASTKRSREDGL